MGQLEKYGLYVLCLVIFLILGVTIWGDGGVTPQRRGAPTSGLNAGPVTPPRSSDIATHTSANQNAAVPNLAALLQPPPKSTPRSGNPTTGSGSDTVGTLNAGGGAANQPVAKVEPTPVPDAPVTPPAETSRTYKVKAGDNFESIAKTVLGSASLRTEIARLNPNVRPERLQIGQLLLLPAASGSASAPAKAVEASGSRDAIAAVVKYTVGKGDTLEGIARRQLGDRRRVADLRELNPGIQPNQLRIGQKINLPKK